MLIISEFSCIDAASGIATLIKWLSGAQVESEQTKIYQYKYIKVIFVSFISCLM